MRHRPGERKPVQKSLVPIGPHLDTGALKTREVWPSSNSSSALAGSCHLRFGTLVFLFGILVEGTRLAGPARLPYVYIYIYVYMYMYFII